MEQKYTYLKNVKYIVTSKGNLYIEEIDPPRNHVLLVRNFLENHAEELISILLEHCSAPKENSVTLKDLIRYFVKREKK